MSTPKNSSVPATNEGPQSLKKQLKALDEKKKGLSKQVGAAKKQGQDCTQLIAEVSQLSDEIKSIKAKLKALQKQTQEPATETVSHGAPQFSQHQPKNSQLSHIVQLSSDNRTSWEHYVQQHPQATIYHSLNTLEVIQQSFQHQPLYLLALDNNDQVCGVLPIIRQQSRLFGDNWTSIPFFNYGGVLADNTSIEEQLMAEAATTINQQGGTHIEYRDSQARPNMPCKTDKISMLLSLPKSTDQLWQDIGTKIRAQIKKAQSYQLHSKTGRKELVDDFYTVFAKNMRDLGTPVYGKQLFLNMLEQHSSAHITLLYQGKRPVAAGFTLGWRNTLEIPWASTLRDANSLNANMLLYWEILQFAISQQYEVFDFGRSSKDASTYKFKKQWGAQPQQLYWHYWLADQAELPQVNPNNPKYTLLINTWKCLPVWITKLIGPPIVKYLP